MKTNLLKFKSIKDKVFYFSFLVTLSIILLLIFISYFISYNSIKNNSISRELDTLEIIGNQIDNSMYKDSVISGIILHTTTDFTFKTNSKLISLPNYNMEFNKWYGAISDTVGNPYFYTTRQIFNMNTGKLIGYLEVFIDESTLSTNYTNSKYTKFTDFFIINPKGVIISSSNQGEISNNIFKLRKNLKLATARDPVKIINNREEDKLTLMLYNNKLNWNIVADIYLKDLIKNKKTLILSLIILSLIGLLCSYILSKSISKSIIKPITNLSLAINQIEKGNWAAEIDILSDDEIGLLSKKFNNLIVYIKNLLDKIRRKNLNFN